MSGMNFVSLKQRAFGEVLKISENVKIKCQRSPHGGPCSPNVDSDGVMSCAKTLV